MVIIWISVKSYLIKEKALYDLFVKGAVLFIIDPQEVPRVPNTAVMIVLVNLADQ